MFKLPLNLADGKYHYTGIKGLQHRAARQQYIP